MARSVEPFEIRVESHVLDDLRDRIRNTRWPDPAPDEPWRQGTDLAYLRDLLDYWANGYDWRAAERDLNRLRHVRVELDGVSIHAVHEKARSGNGVPLILTHGWPSTFTEYLPLVPLLGDEFDLVIPSLPGYGFSQRPPRTGVTYRYVAKLWHQLMRALGYQRYGAVGTDFGSGITTFMGLDDPEPLIGIHLSNLEVEPYTGPGSRPLSEAEKTYLAAVEEWRRTEGGYKAIQSTRPQTVGYGLTDSPVGLAAWILEKWRNWSDSGGDLDAWFPPDPLLTNLTIYWVTRTITSSMRDYYDNRHYAVALGPDDVVRVPTGIAGFSHQYVVEALPPREWAERLYQVHRYTTMPRGGHFAAVEEPDLLAGDIRAFFRSL